jgi:Xaa-Pro aminopeptidase
MPDIRAMQEQLRAAGLDGWLFYDFRGRDPIARSILGLAPGMATRRWFYLVPARGTPRKLVHRIESRALDALPGRRRVYGRLEELERGLAELLRGMGAVAMQYSPRNAIPYVSLVDAGTVELVRSAGPAVVSSAELVQYFEARWTPAQLRMHIAAGRKIHSILERAFARAAGFARRGRRLTEYDLRQWILDEFARQGITTAEGPIAAVGPSSADPHYEPTARRSRAIRRGELLLLDVWGKLNRPGAVYYDVTWTGFLGPRVPERHARVFEAVRRARDAAIALIDARLRAGQRVRGWEADRAARDAIRSAGFGRYFVHRTGHSIGTEVHGNGANLDGLETHDSRPLIPGTCFSVEPGVYLPAFGVRSEVNVFLEPRRARVTGPMQTEILALEA